MDLNRTETSCQPCASYVAPPGKYAAAPHFCGAVCDDGWSACDGDVFWCNACGGNHHVGGWNSCKGGAAARAACEHPVCRAPKEAGIA